MHQVHGSDYLDTFSPVVRPLSISLFLMLVITGGRKIQQIDILNTFLLGNLEEWIIVNLSHTVWF